MWNGHVLLFRQGDSRDIMYNLLTKRIVFEVPVSTTNPAGYQSHDKSLYFTNTNGVLQKYNKYGQYIGDTDIKSAKIAYRTTLELSSGKILFSDKRHVYLYDRVTNKSTNIFRVLEQCSYQMAE